MPRPPLPVGTHGAIKVTAKPGGGYVARTKFRDYDGVTRPVERTGKTATAAKNNLVEALRDRSTAAGMTGTITTETKFAEAAKLWLKEIQTLAENADISDNTYELYERQLRNYAIPALGELRMREINTPRVDALLGSVRQRKGSSTTKTVRSVVSGVMGFAARHGAVSVNPTREARRIKGGDTKKPRALTATERQQWLAQLDGDRQARKKDLPALTRFMLGTGVRIGEALAVSWDEIDLDNAVVTVEWKITRVKGEGLKRERKLKSDKGERTLPLPAFLVEMLRRRKLAASLDREIVSGGAVPVFPDALGGWRDPSNTRRDLRDARWTDGFAWVTSHVFRKTCATILDEAKFTARQVADQLGHSRPSMTQDVYMGRTELNRAAATALESIAGT